MASANSQDISSLATQFDALVLEIEAEEHQSAQALQPPPPERSIEQEHQAMLASANALLPHYQMKQLHSAMLKVHRKVHQRHQLALHHCRLLQARVRSGGYGQDELQEIVRDIQQLLLRIRRENELMVIDRQKIKAEHDAFLATLPPRFTEP